MNQKDLPSIGAPLGGGHFGGIVRINGPLFAVAWAPKAQGETSAIWLPNRAQVPGAASCFDSMANTVAMAEAGSPLAQWARGLDIAGFTDWCVPARDVLELAYRHLKPTDYETACTFRDGDNPSSVPAGYPYTEASPILQTGIEVFRNGAEEAFEEAWYWSSTQSSDSSAWLQHFTYGSQYDNDKSAAGRARAVRLIQLNP